ncbi:ATP-binding cassette domain-containing protein [Arsenophonus symbiont of Ornithomya chloropus]|uniref:ATP-binding cassette domain-containing protein n=1 Tax=Arsenophonus symbiont of Ornithomya chloropus TaxID=634121 RepID=UPI0032B1A965
MSLIHMSGAYLNFNDINILHNAELNIKNNEKICLVGRNGAGKSTLIKVLLKKQALDHGQIFYKPYIKVAYLAQNIKFDINDNVFNFIAGGDKKNTDKIKLFHEIIKNIENNPSKKNLNKLAELETILEQTNLWSLNKKIKNIIQQLDLPSYTKLSVLSGGLLKKVALARTLAYEANIFFLDEPTNHLDIKTILWLENFLKKIKGSIVFISHDRSFIKNIATRIIDIDRGKLVSWPGDYNFYYTNKKKEIEIEKKQNFIFDHKLKQETIWNSRGIKARCTRNKGRIKKLKSMRLKYDHRSQMTRKGNIHIEEISNSSKIIFDFKNVNYNIGNTVIINNFTAQVQNGDKIALIGPNGCGKTTLLKLMLKKIPLKNGDIYQGKHLKIAYFDQNKLQLDLEKTVIDNLSDGKKEIVINGESRNIIKYLRDFLFDLNKVEALVKILSGGERIRLVLARLFLKPSNVLILDEPSNDLDIETIELLEKVLHNYKGTVLIVSHDRQFINNVVTKTWIFEEYGYIKSYVGSTYKVDQKNKENNFLYNSSIYKKNIISKEKYNIPLREKKKKMSYHLLKELEELPIRLEKLENEIKTLQMQVISADFFKKPYFTRKPILNMLSEKENEMVELFKRWKELEVLK